MTGRPMAAPFHLTLAMLLGSARSRLRSGQLANRERQSSGKVSVTEERRDVVLDIVDPDFAVAAAMDKAAVGPAMAELQL